MAKKKGNTSTKPKKLTAKERKFVDEYLIDLNASRAARTAGYSEKTCAVIGYENLRKPHIVAALKEKKESIVAGLDREYMISKELGVLNASFIDYRDTPPEKLPADIKKMVKGWSIHFDDDGDKYYKYVFMDKDKAKENLNKIESLFVEKKEVNVTGGLGSRIQNARKRSKTVLGE